MKHLWLVLTFVLFAFARADAPAPILRQGDTMPNFKAVTLDGKSVQFDSLRGQPVFLYFWSRACQTCGNEYDLVEQIAAQYKNQGLRVIGVNTNDSPNTVRYVADQEGLDFEVWMQDPSSTVSLRETLNAWQGLEDQPILSWAYLIGKDGVIRKYFMGFKENILDTIKTEAFSDAPVVGGMRPGFPMPDFALSDSSGAKVQLSALRGSVVVVNFWGSWCPPCRAEMPELNAMYARLKDKGLRVVGVNLNETKDRAVAYLEQNPVGYDLWYGADIKETQRLFRDWGGVGVPWNIIVGRDGKVHSWMIGFGPGAMEEMESRILSLL
jgi:peroxiredoxin